MEEQEQHIILKINVNTGWLTDTELDGFAGFLQLPVLSVFILHMIGPLFHGTSLLSCSFSELSEENILGSG